MRAREARGFVVEFAAVRITVRGEDLDFRGFSFWRASAEPLVVGLRTWLEERVIAEDI